MSELSNIVKIGKVLVMSCFLITMIKYLKGRRFLGLLFVCQKYKSLVPGGYLVVLIKCLKGQVRSLGSLCIVVKTLIV